MAPMEIEISNNFWFIQGGEKFGKDRVNDSSFFLLKPGESLRADSRDMMIQVRCNRKDTGGQIFIKEEQTTIHGTKEHEIGVHPFAEGIGIRPTAVANIAFESSGEVIKGGITIAFARHVSEAQLPLPEER